MKRFCIIFILFSLCNTVFADGTDYIEVRADRTVLYPQQMDLQDGETLMDLIERYPELLVSGYDDVLTAYQLRMDNVTMSGEIRQLLTQIEAKDLKIVQIVDNPGVAKGMTGLGGVIDITLMPMKKGTHGLGEIRGETNKSINPTLNIRYGGKNTDVWVNTNYGYSRDESKNSHREFIDAHGTTIFGERDRLLTYVKQEYCNMDESSRFETNSWLVRARYFHKFNEMGTELLTLLGYQHTYTPHQYDAFWNRKKRQVPTYLLELTTPLFTKNLTMMLGAEGVYNVFDYNVTEEDLSDEDMRYKVFNQDLYAQFNYTLGSCQFTVGDRIMLYHYETSSYFDELPKYTTRNMFQSSVIYRPQGRHQLQMGYYHKFINPAYFNIYPESWQNVDGKTWIIFNQESDDKKVDQVKLGYTYSTQRLSMCINGNYYRRDYANIWGTDISMYYKYKRLSMTAGAKVLLGDGEDYCCVRFAPKVSLPYQILLAANMIYYSNNAPFRQKTDTTVYGELRAEKQFFKRWNIQLLWHDMFASDHSALMAAVRFNF